MAIGLFGAVGPLQAGHVDWSPVSPGYSQKCYAWQFSDFPFALNQAWNGGDVTIGSLDDFRLYTAAQVGPPNYVGYSSQAFSFMQHDGTSGNGFWGGMPVTQTQLSFAHLGPDEGYFIRTVLDFTSTTNGYAEGLAFTMGGIDIFTYAGLQNFDAFTISATDQSGVSVDVNSFLTNETAFPTFGVTPQGTDAYVKATVDAGDDHSDLNTALNWDSGTQKIGTVTILWDPEINGTTPLGHSAGMGIGALEWKGEVVFVAPEPSSAILLAIPALAFGLGRRRRS